MWYENLDKNFFLKSLYDEIPNLKSVRIEKIELDREGQNVSLVFDLPIYPTIIPKKWQSESNNVVAVEVDFNNIELFELKYDGGYMHGDIEIKLEDDMIKANSTNVIDKAEYEKLARDWQSFMKDIKIKK